MSLKKCSKSTQKQGIGCEKENVLNSTKFEMQVKYCSDLVNGFFLAIVQSGFLKKFVKFIYRPRVLRRITLLKVTVNVDKNYGSLVFF